MTTLIHGQARWGGHERTRDGSRDYDAHIIGAFGIAMIAVVCSFAPWLWLLASILPTSS